jgi:hypothetical protein
MRALMRACSVYGLASRGSTREIPGDDSQRQQRPSAVCGPPSTRSEAKGLSSSATLAPTARPCHNRAVRYPNILLIYTDQQRYDALGANGNREILTPHLDALAAQGVSFERCFVQHPLCMPSRASMLTGQYPATLGITHMGVPLPESTVTLPRLLCAAGYATANIGKLHFLPHANRDHSARHPAYGFDVLQISDEPGVYPDAYRAWARRRRSRFCASPVFLRRIRR